MDIMEMGASDELVTKWKPALDGIDNDYTERVTAQLLENQLKSVQSEARLDETAVGAGTTTVGALGTFQKFAFPLVRRVFPELIANKLVGVQPMSGPVSQVFYMGSARSYGAAREQMYSKYNLTYKGEVTGPLSGGIADLDTMTGETSQGLGSSALNTDSMNKSIANWPTDQPGTAAGHGWSVSAGESLAGTGIPEVSMTIEQQPVVARTKKMRALWTLEASQDLKAYHNLDLERELTDILGKEIRLEVDRELIEDLRGIAYDLSTDSGIFKEGMLDQKLQSNQMDFEPVGDSTFDKFQFGHDGTALVLPGSTQGSNSNVWLVDFTSSALNLAPRHVGDIYANLLATINFASQDIYKTTQRGAGNWILCAPVVASILETASRLTGGIERADGPTNFSPGAIQHRGKFMGRYDLYVDPLYPEGEMLMGYKGSGPMDGGFIYAPYIPFQALPTITDPESFQPRKGILTRYGKVAVAPASRFYRIIRIVGGSGNLTTPFKNV
mgnify:CR=1 FL=1|tara:strand:+ start:11594 stop:13090 length:1497 start_codon:yes stop_codon:yes gene_type:complete